MNNMLKDTNNNIKNIEINHTESIIIDFNWGCIKSIMVIVVELIVLGAGLGGLAFLTGLTGVAAILFWIVLVGSLGLIGYSVYQAGNACFGGW